MVFKRPDKFYLMQNTGYIKHPNTGLISRSSWAAQEGSPQYSHTFIWLQFCFAFFAFCAVVFYFQGLMLN